MPEKPKNSVSHTRVIRGYLEPQLKNNLPKLIEITGMGKSQIVNEGIRKIMTEQNIIPIKTAK